VLGDGYLPPDPGFLQGLRQICDEHQIVLIFDEMITLGLARGGAQDRFGVTPDLTAMGKIIGGGLPMGAVGGRRELMQFGDPSTGGPYVPSSASFAGHVLAVAAGMAQMRLLDESVYARLDELGDRLRTGVTQIASDLDVDLKMTGVGSLCHLHWTSGEVRTYTNHCGCDGHKLNFIDDALALNGYYASAGGRFHLNAAITDSDIDGLLDTLRTAAEDAGEVRK